MQEQQQDLTTNSYNKFWKLACGTPLSVAQFTLNPNKIRPEDGFSIPKNRRDIKSFLGLVGYYRKFNRDLTKMSKSLTIIKRSLICPYFDSCSSTFLR